MLRSTRTIRSKHARVNDAVRVSRPSGINVADPIDDDIANCPSQVATRRRANNGELREDVAVTKSGKGHGPPYTERHTRAKASRQHHLDKQNARLEGQIAGVECIDNELRWLRAEIATSPPGPSRRRRRLERDALLAERELMCMT